MKKKNYWFLFFTVCFGQMFALDQVAYQRLLHGEKNLRGSNLQNTKFKDIDFEGVDFTDADLSGSTFNNVILSNVLLNGTILDRVRFTDTVIVKSRILNNTSFRDSVFDNMTFEEAEITDSSFSNTSINDLDFFNSWLNNVAMMNATTNKLAFISCKLLKDLNFQEAILSSVFILDPCDKLEKINFTKTALSNCCFLGSDSKYNVNSKRTQNKCLLLEANFYQAKIKESFFSNFIFDNCIEISKAAGGLTSIFVDVNSTNKQDLVSLKNLGAKVNGDHNGAFNIFWQQKTDEEFFVSLLKRFGLGFASVAGMKAIEIALKVKVGGCVVQ